MSDSRNSISQILQDTFAELQAQLVSQRKAEGADEGGGQDAERGIQEVVTDLARREGFEVTHVLGMGGMGAVVKATDMRLKRTVALKFLPPKLVRDSKNALELRKEAELASRINHENVVNILSWHEVDSVPFFAMEFVEGETLDQLVRRRGRLPVYEALRIIGEASRGVEALHQSDIIHRDIKPQNIMISRDGRVKITDFGISRTKDMIAEEVNDGVIAGTPKFMSPEQARGEAATKLSDVYSLGATLYFMLTGRSPVESASDVREQLRRVREGKITPIHSILPRLDPRVGRLVTRSMALKQTARAFDVAQFRKDIDEAFLGVREGSRFSVIRWAQRYWRQLLPAGTLCMGLALGGGLTFWIAQHSSNIPAPPPQLSAPLAGLVSMRLELLRQMNAADPSIPGCSVAIQALEEAQQSNDDTKAMTALLSSERLIEQWQILRLLQIEAMDERSPLSADARQRLAAMRGAAREDVHRMLLDWRQVWLYQLMERAAAGTGLAPAPAAEQR